MTYLRSNIKPPNSTKERIWIASAGVPQISNSTLYLKGYDKNRKTCSYRVGSLLSLIKLMDKISISLVEWVEDEFELREL